MALNHFRARHFASSHYAAAHFTGPTEVQPGPLPVGGMGIPIFRRGIDQAPHGDDDEVLMYVIRKFLERVDP